MITRVFISGRRKQHGKREEFEHGRRGHEPKNAVGLFKLEKTRKQIFS